ncbi:MAG TPA: serine/threonine-protein kinase, partial [Kofleriaceae bacterium]
LRLDLKDRFELRTTHWAVKDEALIEVLAAGGVVDSSIAGRQLPPSFVGFRQDGWTKLGFGGFGSVFRVTDARLGHDFAVKVFDPSPFTSHEDARARFLREAGLLFRLHHQHVIRIYDAGEFPNGQPFIKMEYFAGLDLQKARNQRPFANDEALTLVRHLAGAVHHAHERGIVHRDIKPSNILVSQSLSDFRLIDFGLGIVVEEAMERARLTTSAQQFGNAFTAPEQLQNPKTIDPRLDVYSVGAIWFWLHSGRSPYGAGLDEAIAELGLDPYLRDIMRRCMLPMAKRPSAKELLDALDARPRRA